MGKYAVCLMASLVVLWAIPAATRGEWIDGQWVVRPYLNFGQGDFYRKPGFTSHNILCISDWRIADIPRNHKGIEVGVSFTAKNDLAYAYRWIGIWHCEISDAWRDIGMHTDFIRIFGGGAVKQSSPITVVLQDIYIHDGNAMPILIQDGNFDKIILKDIRVERTANSVQLVTINTGYMGQIFIENCRGQRITLCGRPGSIGTVYVKNSPGLQVVDATNKNGKSGAKIVYQ